MKAASECLSMWVIICRGGDLKVTNELQSYLVKLTNPVRCEKEYPIKIFKGSEEDWAFLA